jgi:hypothetical protein
MKPEPKERLDLGLIRNVESNQSDVAEMGEKRI